MDSEYLKSTVGEPLRLCLAELCAKMPADPIEFIGRWLYNYKKRLYDEMIAREEERLMGVEKVELERRLRRLAFLKAERELFEILLRQSMEESGHLERGSPSFVYNYFIVRGPDDPEISYVEEEETVEEVKVEGEEGTEGAKETGEELPPDEAGETAAFLLILIGHTLSNTCRCFAIVKTYNRLRKTFASH